MTAAEISKTLSSVGKDWISWEPETIWAELKRAGVTVSDVLKGKIQAVKTLLTTDAFWKDHLAFEKVIIALNDRAVTFDQYQHPSPAMIARGFTQAKAVSQPHELSDEVCRYAAAICLDDGLIVLPESLQAFQESLDQLTAPVIGRRFHDNIQKQWSERSGKVDGLYGETVTGIQLARMAAVEEYAAAS